MVRTLEAREIEALIAAGDMDIVDVREPHEWAGGHIHGARLVPLAQFKADPRGHLPRDKVIFVCARGKRSLAAAEAAAGLGLAEVYSLDGGLQAWVKAGLPLESPPEPESAPSRAGSASTRAADPAAGSASEAESEPGDSCGLPEPTLDAVVGVNLRELRTQRNLSLDALARMTGLSRALLGQIELGRASPSVSVVWMIARAFDVPFSALLATAEPDTTKVLRGSHAKRLVSPDGRYSTRALFSAGMQPNVEFYELYLAAHGRENALPHAPGTRENLIVTTGRLDLEIAGDRFELVKGDAIIFTADVAHSYINPGSEDCWMYLVMTYANRPA